MPMFSSDSFSKLSTCHIDLQAIFYEVIKHVDCVILEGFRNEQDQNKYFDEHKTKLKWPDGKHNHQPSYAVDVAPIPLDWKNKERYFWFAGLVFGIAEVLKEQGKITHSIRWGGNWSNDHQMELQSFNDFVHFEIIL